jgi:thiol-disulfide isomerase/thioredoxin
MKILTAFLVACLLIIFIPRIAAQTDQKKETDVVLVGPLNFESILDIPGWFDMESEYMKYRPQEQFLDEIPKYIQDVEMVCVLGSWCSDSRREVPRLIRIMQAKNLDVSKVKFFGVDRNKVTPNGETAQYDIQLVPTFIFFRAGKEIGRIVETPTASMEQHILEILHPSQQGLPGKVVGEPENASQQRPTDPHDPGTVRDGMPQELPMPIVIPQPVPGSTKPDGQK